MARKRYKPEEIVSLLRQAEFLHGWQSVGLCGEFWLGSLDEQLR